MPLDDQDEENLHEPAETVEQAAMDALSEVFKDPADDDGPRDTPFARWSKFLVIMVALGLIVGGIAAASTYAFAARPDPETGLPPFVTDQQWAATVHDIRRNGVFGFMLGAAIGGTYVIKCLVRGVDP